MRKLNLILLAVFFGFVFTSCAREKAKTDAETKEGIMGPVLSTEKQTEPARKVASPALPAGDILVVADFNTGTKPSNIGGDFGSWNRDPADFSQGCMESFDAVNKYGDSGFGIKLDYDVDSPNPAYNGFWMKLNNLDASNFKKFAFFVKGDAEAGYTIVFKIELKNTKGEVGRFYVTGVDTQWKEVSVPLRQFIGINSFNSLTEFVVVFEDTMATNKDGVIYIDEIRFVN